MPHEVFQYRGGELFCEECALSKIADSVPAPFYVYSSGCLVKKYSQLDEALSGVRHLICYALKANSQAELLRYLVRQGAGAEVVSGAELALALRVGFTADKVVFSGVGKTEGELEAGIRAGILLFLVESEGELTALNDLASRFERRAGVGIRINPDVDPLTHPHISTGIQTAKFGLDPATARGLYARWREFPGLRFRAIHAHIGSQITSSKPLAETARLLVGLVDEVSAHGLAITEVDCGGGLGIRYGDETPPSFQDYVRQIVPAISRTGARLILEPGRSLVGPAGCLVVRVLYLKQVHGRRFAVVNSGMHDLLRPALYGAYHAIVPLEQREGEGRAETLDVVGAACESSDVFGHNRRLGEIRPGDLLAILDTGAYGFSMSSNYNLRPRAAEVVVEGSQHRVVRPAETIEELVGRELGHRPAKESS